MSVSFQPDCKAYPYQMEMNVANGNAPIILQLMGINPNDEKVSHNSLLTALDYVESSDPANFVRKTTTEDNWTYHGVTEEQIDNYKKRISLILAYCYGKGCDLVWF